MASPWWIIGCGYTGAALARALVARGADVTITRRAEAAAVAQAAELAAGASAHTAERSEATARAPAGRVRGVRADLAEPATLAIPPGAIVVCTAPPGRDPAGELRALLRAARDAAKLVYVSSTGVYAPGGGARVDEAWPIAPITASGRARAAAEAVLAEAAIPWVSLRAAGIYGPGRGLVERIRAGTYRVVGDGASHVGRIHVADLVAAILAAATSPVTGAINAADDDPAPIGEVADAVAAALGRPPPPRTPVAEVSAEVAGMLTADRVLVNRRLRDELGVALRYPSWRATLAEELATPP
jgi:nucleoside-diphosphate-sugar epimerase